MTEKTGGGGVSGLKPPMLLRKPPQSASLSGSGTGSLPSSISTTAGVTDGNNNNTTKSVYINTGGMTSNVDTDAIPPLSLADSEFGACSTAAVAETSDMMDDDDDDEWGDFTTSTSTST